MITSKPAASASGSPANGFVDTTTAHGKLALGMFALMAEYQAAATVRVASPRSCALGNCAASAPGSA